MRPACRSSGEPLGHQSMTDLPSLLSVAQAALIALKFPPWPLTKMMRRAQSADRQSSTMQSSRASFPIDNVPGNPWCSPEAVIEIAGATRQFSVSAALRVEISSAIRVSVSRGRCGPCCSHEPIGMSKVMSVSRSGQRAAPSWWLRGSELIAPSWLICGVRIEGQKSVKLSA